MRGFLVREFRRRKRIKQDELAQKLGIDRTTVSYHEKRGSWPDDLLEQTASILDAPELLIINDTPMNAVYLGRVDHPLVAISWLREELQEAINQLDAQESDIRRGYSGKEYHGKYAAQIYDLHTALGAYFMSAAHYLDIDVIELHKEHLAKVERYRTIPGDAVTAA